MAAAEGGRDPRAEGTLLLLALRAAAEPTAALTVSRYSPDQWQTVLRHAEWHDVLSLLAHRLQSANIRTPVAVAERLRAAYVAGAARGLAMSAQLAELLRAMRAEQIPVIPLKGAALAEPVYGNVALRPMRDLDVLVEPERLEDAGRVLLALGYGPPDRPSVAEERAHWHHLTPFRRARSLSIEVHWTLEMPSSPFAIDVPSLWSRALAATFGGQPALSLAPEDQLLHLCLHAAYHHRFRVRLRHLADISAVLARHGASLRWDELSRRASAWGIAPFVSCTLAVAAELLGTPAPDDARIALAHAADDDELVEVARAFVMAAPLRLPIMYRQARRAEGAREKAQVYLRGVFPTPDKLRSLYDIPPGSWSLPLYYVVRPLDLARRLAGLAAYVGKGRDRLPLSLERERNGIFIDRWIARHEGAPSRATLEREDECR